MSRQLNSTLSMGACPFSSAEIFDVAPRPRGYCSVMMIGSHHLPLHENPDVRDDPVESLGLHDGREPLLHVDHHQAGLCAVELHLRGIGHVRSPLEGFSAVLSYLIVPGGRKRRCVRCPGGFSGAPESVRATHTAFKAQIRYAGRTWCDLRLRKRNRSSSRFMRSHGISARQGGGSATSAMRVFLHKTSGLHEITSDAVISNALAASARGLPAATSSCRFLRHHSVIRHAPAGSNDLLLHNPIPFRQTPVVGEPEHVERRVVLHLARCRQSGRRNRPAGSSG